jgi:hypothetical protein
MSKPTSSVTLNTSLSPVAHGVLGALAQREDPAHAAANVVLTRLLREELDRLAPGAWDELIARQRCTPAEVSPREASVAVADFVAERLSFRSKFGR